MHNYNNLRNRNGKESQINLKKYSQESTRLSEQNRGKKVKRWKLL